MLKKPSYFGAEGRFGITEPGIVSIKLDKLIRSRSTISVTSARSRASGLTQLLTINKDTMTLDMMSGPEPMIGEFMKVSFTHGQVKGSFEVKALSLDSLRRTITVSKPKVIFWYERRNNRRVETNDALPFRLILDDGLSIKVSDISLSGVGCLSTISLVEYFDELDGHEMENCAFEFDGRLIDGVTIALARYKAIEYGSDLFSIGFSIVGGNQCIEIIETFMQRAMNVTDLYGARQAKMLVNSSF